MLVVVLYTKPLLSAGAVALTLERLVKARVTLPLVGVMELIEETLELKSEVKLVILFSVNEGISEVCNNLDSHLLSVLFQ